MGLSFASIAAAEESSVNLAWNANPETNIAGYHVRYGTTSGALTLNLEAGITPAAVVTGLEPGRTYYCAVQAFNTASVSGPLSTEISFIAPGTAKPEISVETADGGILANGESATNFGSVNLGAPAVTRTFTIKNLGAANLTGLSVVSYGLDFTTTALATATLAPGASTSFTATFSPTASGNRFGFVQVASNDTDENPFEIELGGTGVALPEISIEQPVGFALIDGDASVNFNNSNLGTTGPADTFTIRNTGTANLTGLAITSDGVHAADFIVGAPAATTLAPGASTTFPISFKPSATGTRTAAIHVASNDADENPFDISLSGNGVGLPEIVITRADTSPLIDGLAIASFGGVNLGASSAAEIFTIRNAGTANLTGLAVSIAGDHASDFTAEAPVASVLAPGATTTFKVTFRPGAAGTRSASVRVASNDADENPFDIALSGSGIAIPDISVARSGSGNLSGSLPAVSLGSVNIGASGALETFVISNPGTADLTGLEISVDGANASEFAVQPAAAASLIPGASTTFKVTFKPVAAGTRSTILHIASNDPDQSSFDIALSGNGVPAPEIAISKSDTTVLTDGAGALGFGNINLGSASAAQIIVITNVGTASLTGITVAIDGTHASNFTASFPAASLAPGASTTCVIFFIPSAAGTRGAVLHVASNDADENPFDIALGGTGVLVPEIAVSTSDGTDLEAGESTFGFGNVNLGATSSAETLTIRNTGTAPLTGITISADGVRSADFIVGLPATTTLAPGASTTFQLSFIPSAPGPSFTVLHIASNDADENPFDLSLTGSGIAIPVLAVEDASGSPIAPGAAAYPFDGVVIGTTGAPATFVIRNTGTAALTGLQLSAIGTHASSFTFIAPAVTTLDPGASASFTVAFKPASGGLKTAAIRIDTGLASQAPFDIALRGSGITVPEIAILQDSANLTSGTATANFGGVNIGSVSTAKSYTIRNLGSAPLTGLSVAVSGTHDSDFATTSPSATTLAPGASTTFKVTFEPTDGGARNARISVASNDADESPFLIAVTGNGLEAPEIQIGQSGGKDLKDSSAFISFGGVETGTTSKGQIFTIRNTGTAKLENLSIVKNGLHGSDFTVTALKTKSLAPGASTSFKIFFKPGENGIRWGAIHIASNDSDEAPFDIVLTGNGKSGSSSARKKKAAFANGAPAVAPPVRGVEVIDGKKYRTLTILKTSAREILPRDIEVSSNLVDWSSGTRHTTVLLDTATTLKVRDNTPVTQDGKRYIRLGP